MKDKEMIEEMAKDIKSSLILHINKTILYPYLATDLYNAGYRKVPEDSVMLSRKEYDDMYSFKTTRGGFYNILDTVRKVERKETAKEFYDKVMSYIGSNQKFWIVDEEHITIIDVDKLFDFVMETAKQFGVEVEE